MPEPGQGTLSDQLTAQLARVLVAWHARGQAAPRLAYVSVVAHADGAAALTSAPVPPAYSLKLPMNGPASFLPAVS
jgi:hypothetical protein